jgi:hypothetical protein
MPESGCVGCFVYGTGSALPILTISINGSPDRYLPCGCAAHSSVVRWIAPTVRVFTIASSSSAAVRCLIEPAIASRVGGTFSIFSIFSARSIRCG